MDRFQLVGWLSFVVFVVVVVDGAYATLSLSVHHRLGRNDAKSVAFYAGQPRHLVEATLVLSQPPAEFAPGIRVSARDNDVAGQYAALYLSRNDPLAAPTAAARSSSNLLELPRVAIFASGETVHLVANTTSAGSSTPALVLTPGSAAWLTWQGLVLTRNTLILARRGEFAAPAGAWTLPCVAWDALGRCEVAPASGVPGYRTVLDLDSASGTLPAPLAATLMHHPERDLRWQSLSLVRPQVSGANDLGDGSAMGVFDMSGATAPAFVVDSPSSSSSNESLVIGRRTLARLFTVLAYDSATATWYAVPAVPLPEAAAITLGILLVLQAVVTVRFFVSTLHMRLRAVLLAQRVVPFAPAVDKTQLVYMVLSCVFAIVSAALAQTYTGRGDHVDATLTPHLRHFALGALVFASVQSALLLIGLPLLAGPDMVRVFWERGRSLPPAKEPALTRPKGSGGNKVAQWVRDLAPLVEMAANLLHVAVSATGIAAALTPLACRRFVGILYLSLAVVLLLLVPYAYHVLSLVVALLAAQFRSMRRTRFYLLVLFALVQVVGLGLVTAAVDFWVLRPLLWIDSDLYTTAEMNMAAHAATGVLLVAVSFFVAAECSADLREVVATIAKKDA